MSLEELRKLQTESSDFEQNHYFVELLLSKWEKRIMRIERSKDPSSRTLDLELDRILTLDAYTKGGLFES